MSSFYFRRISDRLESFCKIKLIAEFWLADSFPMSTVVFTNCLVWFYRELSPFNLFQISMRVIFGSETIQNRQIHDWGFVSQNRLDFGDGHLSPPWLRSPTLYCNTGCMLLSFEPLRHLNKIILGPPHSSQRSHNDVWFCSLMNSR